METFGRGCLYCVLGVVGIMVLAMITQSTINIPWFIFIPAVVFAFWAAGKKTKDKDDE
jgi:hypothetical protein